MAGTPAMNADPGHTPVLLTRTLELLAPAGGELAVDLTTGRGGHSLSLAEAVKPDGVVIGIDADSTCLKYAADRVRAAGGCFEPFAGNFVEVPAFLRKTGRRADVVLADLGFCSSQMDDPERGFSFSAQGPLDMRYDTRGPLTAEALIARSTERELAEIIRRWGEDPLAGRIARKLVQTRQREPIRSTTHLARLVLEAYGPRARFSRIHPATRTFQAFRIAVNEETVALRSILQHIARGALGVHEGGWLNRGARVAIISFHSLEDRAVKRAFAEMASRGLATPLTKGPLTADKNEIAANPRSRSAKLRAIRVDGPGTTERGEIVVRGSGKRRTPTLEP